MSSESSSVTSAPVRLTGRVKWFNNKTGFGFISVVGGNDQFKDASEIFVHHSAVTVSQEQYRYLVEGEYVEFSVVDTETGTHKFQAGDVRGVKGGKLFCETRREHRAAQDGGAGGAPCIPGCVCRLHSSCLLPVAAGIPRAPIYIRCAINLLAGCNSRARAN